MRATLKHERLWFIHTLHSTCHLHMAHAYQMIVESEAFSTPIVSVFSSSFVLRI